MTISLLGDDISKIVISIKTIIYTLFLTLNINIDVVEVLGWLMLIDTVLGVVKSFRLEYKVTFKKLIWGAITKISVLIIPMILALTAKGLDFDFTWVVSGVLNILVVAEAFSCITNIIEIKEKRKIENSDIITRLLFALRNIMANMIDKLLSGIENKKQ